MQKLKTRVNRIENKLHPSGEQIVIIGESKEELDRKQEEYLKHGNPHAIIVRVITEKIDKTLT